MDKRKVILVTDGDLVAQEAVEIAAHNIGGRCISRSAGNPTVLSGREISMLIHEAKNDPVVVMVDDKGAKGVGRGEAAMNTLLADGSLEVLGVVAVSSNGKDCHGIDVTCSITRDGKLIDGAVNKYGRNIHTKDICGDTLSILRNRKDLVIVGIGDPGKMDYEDEASRGAPITTLALKEILRRKAGRH